MGSYPHPGPLSHPHPPNISNNDHDDHDDNNNDNNDSETRNNAYDHNTDYDNASHHAHPPRFCSVRGCTTVLPFEYSLKMCENCRGRHRVYAHTKRQKRKLEKMALGGQHGPVVWMPQDPPSNNPESGDDVQLTQSPVSHAEVEPAPPQHHHHESHPHHQHHHHQELPEPPLQSQQQFTLSPSTWDNNAIDPRLFTQQSTSSSELAGALILPSTPRRPPPPTPSRDVTLRQQQQQSTPSTSATPPALPVPPAPAIVGTPSTPFPSEQSSVAVSLSPAALPDGSNIAPRVEISARALSEAAAQLGGDASLPHRYCSIKGCKTVIPGDSFFKMCDNCRNRYRNYGTTKRAKWKREKEVAVAELQSLRAEEDKSRAERGLSPLPRDEIEWQSIPEDTLDPSSPHDSLGHVLPLHAPRMCTVSHCREILPSDYGYLRCERHRIQNRHHSKLKRVRDKESKALAFGDWAAAVGALDQKPDDVEDDLDEDDAELYDESDNFAAPVRQDSESFGVPPAARGTRRTNHVCCIKVCYNLLSPSNPWKMCDLCRSRDRTARKIKALRESGIPVSPLPPRTHTFIPQGDAESYQKKKRKKRKQKQVEQDSEGGAGVDQAENAAHAPCGEQEAPEVPAFAGDVGNNHGPAVSRGPVLTFMDTILPEDSPLHLEAVDTGLIATDPRETAPQNAAPAALSTEIGASPTVAESADPPEAVDPKPTRRKRSARKKVKEKLSGTEVEVTSTAVAAPSNSETSHPAAPPMQHPYHMPYYLPPPFALPPFTTGRAGAPVGMYPRDPYRPPSGYHPAYPFPAYSYPPHMGYAFPPPFPIPPPPLPPPDMTAATPTAAAPALLMPVSAPPIPTPGAMAALTPPAHMAGVTALEASVVPPADSQEVEHSSQVHDPLPQPHGPLPQSAFQSSFQGPIQLNDRPPAHPPDFASMYSTFRTRPNRDRTFTIIHVGQDHTTPAEGSSLSLTFNAKTGETYSRPAPTPGFTRRKKADIPDDGRPAFKRQAVEAGDNDVGEPNDTVQFVYFPGNTANAPHNLVVSEAPEPVSMSKPVCGSKNCNRPLPLDASGNLCDKCKEKVKKKQMKVKQRFRLEPKKMITPGAIGANPQE